MGGSVEQGGLRASAPASVRLIETMRWEPGAGVLRRGLHLERLAAGCAALAIAPEPGAVARLLDAVTGAGPLRLRLTLGLAGDAELTQAPLPGAKATWRLGLAAARLCADDPWRRIKSTERGLYDATRAHLPEGWDEAVFLNDAGELVEGTITNVFVRRGDVLLTPPVASGALPGVLRAELLATGLAREAVLWPADLRGAPVFLGNALRGLIAAEVI